MTQTLLPKEAAKGAFATSVTTVYACNNSTSAAEFRNESMRVRGYF